MAHELPQAGELPAGRRQLSPGHEGPSPGVVPDGPGVCVLLRGLGVGQDPVVVPEPHPDLEGPGGDALEHGQARGRQELDGDQLRHLVRGLDRHAPPPGHRRCEGHEVVVVGVVSQDVEVHSGPLILDVRLVGVDGVLIGTDGVHVASDPDVDVPGHVHEVAGTGHEVRQSLGAGDGPGRFHGLHRMDEEVAGAGVVRVCGYHPLEMAEELQGARLGLTPAGPVRPRPQGHEGLGEQGRRFQVGRMIPDHLPQRARVGRIPGGTIGSRLVPVPPGRGPDEGPLHRGDVAGPSLGLPDRLEGEGLQLGVHGEVDVGAEGDGDSPPAHGAGGIPAGTLLEGANRLGVVEGVVEAEPLVEVALGDRLGRRDPVVVLAQVVVERYGVLGHRPGQGQHRGPHQHCVHGSSFPCGRGRAGVFPIPRPDG
jgi:hypothetical protein